MNQSEILKLSLLQKISHTACRPCSVFPRNPTLAVEEAEYTVTRRRVKIQKYDEYKYEI